MTTETAAKKDTQKLQRAIVDGLEDVKGQDIQVFNTEHLSPLFERVIVASGTSNRQTKALASSVIDAVREAGFPKPRIEGEDNGEWIIVDCGAAVAHIMQPAIRQYYHLEEIWGEKPIRLRLGAPKPVAPVKAATPAKKASPSLRRSSAAKTAARDADREAAAARKAPAKKAPAKKAPAKTAAKGGASSTARSAAGKAALKTPAKKAPAKKATAKKSPGRA
jgi:ribosome-associated protein